MSRHLLALALAITGCHRASVVERDPTPERVDASTPAPPPGPELALLHGNVIELATGKVRFAHELPKPPWDEWSDGRVGYAVEQDGSLRARDLASGKQLWSASVACRRIVASALHLACFGGGDLVVVDRKSGAANTLPGTVVDDVAAQGDRFVATHDDQLLAIDPSTAKVTNTASVPSRPEATFARTQLAAVGDGVCFVTFEPPAHHVRCVTTALAPLRDTRVEVLRPGDPKHVATTVQVLGPRYASIGTFSFVSGPLRRSIVVRLADGAVVSTVEDEVSALAEQDGALAGLVVSDPEIRLLDTKGATKWTAKDGVEPASGAVIVPNRIVIATYHPIATGVFVRAYDLAGKPAWQGETHVPPISHSKYRNDVRVEKIADAVIVRGEESGARHVHVYDAGTGKLRWYSAVER